MDQAYESILKSNRSALIYAATRFMAIKRISACVVEVPETDPQQYVVAGTPEQIAGLLPEAGIKPARRKDDLRPTEPLSFEDEAAPVPPVAPADVTTLTRYNPNDSTRHYADFPEGPMLEARAGLYVKFADVQALLAAPAAPAVQVVPEGWKLLPPDPSQEMMDAYERASIAPVGKISKHGYRAMFAAAPAAPAVTVSPAPRMELPQALEAIAQQWDDCECEAPGGFMDIGESLRREFAKLDLAHLARQAQPTDRDAVLEEAAIKADAFAESVHPRNASTARNIAAAIRALKGKSGEGAAS